MNRRQFAALTIAAAASMMAGAAVQAASAPAEWDGLVKVKSKKMDVVYLLPGADFRPYQKVMIDPTEIAFEKNWQRDYNRSANISQRISDGDLAKVVDQGSKAATEIFAKAYSEGGYQVVSAPGPDVLRLRTGVVNVHVNAPERMTAGRSRTYAPEAGQATLVIEARDSLSGALLGRAVDRRYAGDNAPLIRDSVTNRADFRLLARNWAKWSVNGLTELKRLSPLSAGGSR